jgi:hypothetical protein
MRNGEVDGNVVRLLCMFRAALPAGWDQATGPDMGAPATSEADRVAANDQGHQRHAFVCPTPKPSP